MSKRVLCLLVAGFEEIEAVTPVDLLRRAGAEVILASLTSDSFITGRTGIIIQADCELNDVANEDFDLLLIPGGPGVQALRSDGRPARLARQFFNAGKLVAAICAAPTVLGDAGLLEGKKFTAHFSIYEEFPGALSGERVVQDGLLITSRGAGTALDFALQIVRTLYGDQQADEISASIMAV